jgi:hypothetical protein
MYSRWLRNFAGAYTGSTNVNPLYSTIHNSTHPLDVRQEASTSDSCSVQTNATLTLTQTFSNNPVTSRWTFSTYFTNSSHDILPSKNWGYNQNKLLLASKTYKTGRKHKKSPTQNKNRPVVYYNRTALPPYTDQY